MKLPSLAGMIDKAVYTVKRFPLPVLSGALAAFTAINAIEMRPADADLTWELMRICLLLLLSIPAFVSYEMLVPEKKWWRWGAQWVTIGYLVWMYYSWYEKDMASGWALFFLTAIAFHLMVSFTPFVRSNDMSRFWEYNKNVFLRLLTSVFYSGVLFAGLSLAIVAIDQLFEVRIRDERYAELFMLIGMVFNTWFFLSGFPENPEEAEVTEYPKGLRIFTQFVLLPLVTVYLIILYAYSAKILFTSNWPSGWVSYLVIGFSSAGILALLLIWPLREDERHRWIKLYAKGFFFALFPLVVLLFFSIYMRITQYGITLNRYFVILLALWLLFVASYFLISRKKRVKMIPLSLFAAAIIAATDPLGSFAVSLRSQRARLIDIGEKYDFYKEGKFTRLKSKSAMPLEEQIRFYEIVDYLTDTYPADDFSDLFPIDADSVPVLKRDGRFNFRNKLIAGLGMADNLDANASMYDHFSLSSSDYNSPLNVAGYDYCFTWDYYSGKRDDNEKIELADSVLVVLNFDGNELKFLDTKGELLGVVKISEIHQKLVVDQQHTTGQFEPDKMFLMIDNDKLKAAVHFRYIYGKLSQTKIPDTENINSTILIKFK